MAVVSLQSFLLGNPNPKLSGNGRPASDSRRHSCSSSHCPSEAVRRPLGLAHAPPLKNGLGPFPLSLVRRTPRMVPLSASRQESKHGDVEMENDKTEAKIKAEMSREAWKELLEYFRTEGLKIKAMSQEAYAVYSKKSMEVLMEASEKLKIQAAIAQHDLSILAKEISEEGKGYLSTAAMKSPDFVKDIAKAYSSIDEFKNMSDVRDFHLGIPYGAFLALGGFLHFMLTGSIPAIRFGVILGTSILVLSVSSLRSWKSGKATPFLLKSQTAIAAIIFLRQWRLWFQRGSFPTFLMFLISGAMVAFYLYRIRIDGENEGPKLEQSSESETL